MLFKKNSKIENKIGKSRGGKNTKIHATVNEKGLPMRLILSEGNRNDIKFAKDLIDGIKVKSVLVDANWFRNIIQNPVIPCRKNRKVQIEYDKELYKKRNVVERLFGFADRWFLR